jgi:hypothetical protein
VPKSFPDVAGTGILHSRIVEILRNEGCTGFDAHPIKWRELEEWCEWVGPKAQARAWPQYYRLEILGNVDLDWSLIDNDPTLRCRECHAPTPGVPAGRALTNFRLPVEGTWDGTDFCAYRNVPGDSTKTLCSRRVVDLAAKYKWSNVSFGRTVPPDVKIASPIPSDWFDQISNNLKERHPEFFQK